MLNNMANKLKTAYLMLNYDRKSTRSGVGSFETKSATIFVNVYAQKNCNKLRYSFLLNS